MATLPCFVLGPNAVLSALGLLRGPDPTVPTPSEDWRTAKVDVIIPALNEQENIALVLASAMRQTLRPRQIVLVDDGSADRTIEVAEAFCAAHGLDLIAIRRRKPIGKTPTIKRQALELDSDVEFILDADTVLESDNYIERTVQELYQAVGIASACGTILPLTRKRRQAWAEAPGTRGFTSATPKHPSFVGRTVDDLARGATNLYREVLYLFLQRFVYRGQMLFFGTTSNPVGCAVAYRRKYVQNLFQHFTPILGDDLTNSEDIFIGLALLDQGYRNIQLTDVYARTVEPPVHRLPRQLYFWSSAFLQSCYYFDPLVKSPLRALKRKFTRRRLVAARAPQLAMAGGSGGARIAGGAPGFRFSNATAREIGTAPHLEPRRSTSSGGHVGRESDRRRIREPYRQAFGRHRTVEFGRPAGWMLMMSAVEKVFFPTALLIMALLGNWHGLALTVLLESLIGVVVLAIVMKGRRLEYIAKAIAVVPLRYALLVTELFTLGRFATELWITKTRTWRK